MENTTIKLAIIEDDSMVAQLLKTHIEENSKIHVLYVVNGGNEFFTKLENEKEFPDVILLDLRMQNGNGVEVLEKLSIMDQDIKVIVMSSLYDPSYMGQMLKLGCDAFLSKEIDPEELITIIHKVYQYGHYFTEEQIISIRKQVSPKSPKLHINSKDSLSMRELEVLQLLAQQLTTREIAERLFVSSKTIEMHKSNLLLKTGTRNSVGLIMYAVRNQLIDPNNLLLLD